MAYSNRGYREITTSLTTTSIEGSRASNLSIYATGGNATFTLIPGRNDDGATFTVPDGFTVTLTGLNLAGFAVTPGTATCHCYWW